jgi:hypothetical protein
MRVVAWNSQGAKWDALWTNWMVPQIALGQQPPKRDVLGVLVESGWAPWVTSGPVTENVAYPLGLGETPWMAKPLVGAFSTGVTSSRGQTAYWVPWVKTPDALKPNSRCSLGGTTIKLYSTGGTVGMMAPFADNLILRPVVRIQLIRAKNTWMTVLVVHLISGWWQKAMDHMMTLVSTMSTFIPQSTPALIVGDMNIDLQTVALTPKPGWRVLRTGVATQQSGGELDFGLLYDPNQQYPNAGVTVLQQYKSGANGSDHSVLVYVV